MIEQLIRFFSKPASETKGQAPEGYCPNCWGEQEYDQQIREMRKDQQIDVNNHQANYAFIQDFVVTRIDGIHLKNKNHGMECPVCQLKVDKS